jgi:hypothetical protein
MCVLGELNTILITYFLSVKLLGILTGKYYLMLGMSWRTHSLPLLCCRLWRIFCTRQSPSPGTGIFIVKKYEYPPPVHHTIKGGIFVLFWKKYVLSRLIFCTRQNQWNMTFSVKNPFMVFIRFWSRWAYRGKWWDADVKHFSFVEWQDCRITWPGH